MNVSGNRILRTTLALGIVALCLLSVPLSANLGLLFLYIEPNPRHMPPALMGEAVGWTIIGLLTAALTVVIAEAVFWPSNQRFLERNKAPHRQRHPFPGRRRHPGRCLCRAANGQRRWAGDDLPAVGGLRRGHRRNPGIPGRRHRRGHLKTLHSVPLPTARLGAATAVAPLQRQ